MSKENRWLEERECCEIEGELRASKEHGKLACLVVNLSDRGAGLDVSEDVLLPERFYLSLPLLEGLAHERLVELRWRRGRAAGVMFV